MFFVFFQSNQSFKLFRAKDTRNKVGWCFSFSHLLVAVIILVVAVKKYQI